MNWKEQPHLFANGKFKVTNQSGDVFALDGYVCKQLWVTTSDNQRAKMFDPKNCTLIARKIEGMTDEEIKTLLSNVTKSETKNYKFAGTLYKGDYRIFYEERRRKNEDRFDGMVFKAESANRDSFLYLLSIGVYPFDQSHFETGEVIDINKIQD